MRAKPLVSIITPTYNTGRFLEECIQSVLHQDHPYVEHIIQDGASTDNTLSILKKYSASSYKKKVKWVSESDRGQTDALNKGLQRSKGDILLVLNADDALLPNACSWAVENMKKYPKAAVIYGEQYLINEKGEIIGIGVTGEFDFVKFFCIEQYMATQAAFIRRSMFEKVGFRADTTLETMPDYEIWVRIGSKLPMKHVWGVVTRYRIYPHMDGKNPRSAERFIKAKSTVIERVINSPDTPQKIKNLRRRAYAGLYSWVADEMFFLGNFKQYVWYITKAFITYPSKRTFNKFYQMVKETVFWNVDKVFKSSKK